MARHHGLEAKTARHFGVFRFRLNQVAIVDELAAGLAAGVEARIVLGALAMQRLEAARSLPNVTDVRGLGLMVAVEFQAEVGGAIVSDLVEEGLREGMILHPAGLKHEVIRLMPPLNIDEAVFAEALDRLAAMMEKVTQTYAVPR